MLASEISVCQDFSISVCCVVQDKCIGNDVRYALAILTNNLLIGRQDDNLSIEFTFDKVCNELVQVLPEIKKTRWSHLIDFYSLFTVLAEVQDSLPLAQDGREALHEKLLAFGNGITSYQRKSDDDKKSDNTNIVLYASGIRNSSDLNARKNRYSALKSELGF